jgi:hypothetical protein
MRIQGGAGVTAEVNGPIVPPGGGQVSDWLDLSSGATWATIWFLVVVLLMFVV